MAAENGSATPERRITLVVNPSSGGGRAERLLPRVEEVLHHKLRGAEVRVRLSTAYQHARDLCEEAVAEGVTDLLVMGGDGMAHLGLNACAGTDVRLGVLPAGTGNDFVRGARLPRTVTLATDAVVAGSTRTIDLFRVTGAGLASDWVGSVVSTGYDARVNHRTNNSRLRLGVLDYARVALTELATFRPLTYRLEVDGQPRDLEAMLVAVGNAGWFGGGMNICPGADVHDGLLDICIVHPLSRKQLLAMLPTVFVGQHVRHPQVEMLKARVVRVDGDKLLGMGDGEPLGDVPITVECTPGVLQVLAV